MNIYVKIIIATLTSVVLLHLGKVVYTLKGYGNQIMKHYPGECHVVEGFTTGGSEDMTLLPAGKILVTSGLKGFSKDFDYSTNLVKGAIYMVDTKKSFKSVEKLNIVGWPADRNFEPHGLSHWVHKNKSVSVFIVFHMPEAVGRFLYDGKNSLTLTKLYQDYEHMRNINSVSLTGEDSFYLTNMLQARFRDRLSATIELLLFGFKTSNVLYVNDNKYMVAADGLLLPNGVTGDDRFVYVNTNGAVKVFTKRSDNTLQYYKSIPITIGSLDNVKIDEFGDLWLGCQNVLEEAVEHLDYPDRYSCRSSVIRVKDPTGVAEVESVFVDDTSLIQASTVAIYTNRKLLIGSIVDKMVVCDVNYLSGRY